MKKGLLKVLLGVGMLVLVAGTALSQNTAKKGGEFSQQKFETMTLHIYTTHDGAADVTYIFEKEDGLVLFELPSMHHLSKELKVYVDGLNKPVKAILAGYHVGGASYYPGVPVYAGKESVRFIDSGGEMAYRKMLAGLFEGFDLDVVRPTHVIETDRMEIGGIPFRFFSPTTSPIPGMDVVIPEINAYYMHVGYNDTHPVLLGMAHIDQVIAELKRQKAGGYAFYFSSHDGIEAPDALDRKIAYLEKTKAIRQASPTPDVFRANMNAAFPDHKKPRFLERTVENLYK